MTSENSVVSGERIGHDPQPKHNPPPPQNQEKSIPPRALSGREDGAVHDPRGGRWVTRCLRAFRNGADFVHWTLAVWRDEREGRVC